MVCPEPRVSIDALSRLLQPSLPNIPPAVLHSQLFALNKVYDRAPDGADPRASISRAEAGWFILDAKADQRLGQEIGYWRTTVMTTLQQIFFQGRDNWQIRPEQKYPVRITRCADGDTCLAEIMEAPACGPLVETLRFSAVDTPESFVSGKLNRIRNELTLKLAQKYGLPPDPLRPLVQMRIQYTGHLASMVMKDFAVWLQEQGGSFAISNSYSSNDFIVDPHNQTVVPNKYKFLWQPYCFYMRRVVTLHATPGLISRYMRERLPVLMATDGQLLYRQFLTDYGALLHSTFGEIPAVRLGGLSPASVVNPATIFTPAVAATLAAQWEQQVLPLAYGDDWTIALVHLGFGFYYPKYDNQHRAMYTRVQVGAIAQQSGLWRDEIFQMMGAGTMVPLAPDDPDD